MNATRRWLRGSLALLALGLAHCGGGDEGGGSGPPPPTTLQVVDAYPALEFNRPLFLTSAPGDDQRLFVVSQLGVIYVFDNDAAVADADVFLDIRDRVTDAGGEQGLLGLAFDPDYPANGLFYVNYNPNFDDTGANPRRTHISRFQAAGDVADPQSETVLLTYEQPFPNHKGGWLGFGPDGKLYIATGDGGSAGDPNNNAQNLSTLLGKFLRIDKDGTVPADNPFVGTSGARGEIWALGLRNPYRAGFDRATGELWAGDVGQNQIEEIDKIVKGGNYGWRKFEGTQVFNAADPTPANAIGPVFEYGHEGERCTVVGGYRYRGAALSANFDGSYFFADFCSGELFRLPGGVADAAAATPIDAIPGNPTSFGEDADGELYITSFDGHIYKLVPGDD
jgi:glucose/arabinose dehydrogenase